jgi:outer membrane protein TolC
MSNFIRLSGVAIFLGLAAASLAAQAGPARLTLKEAAQLAIERNPALQAAAQDRETAKAQTRQAKSMYYPRVDFRETFTNGNNPVYAFGSLLNQRSFTAADFALDRLNHPDPLTNFKSEVSVYQSIWEGGKTQSRNRMAGMNEQVKERQEAQARQQILFDVVKSYFAVQLGQESLAATRNALASAEANRQRVQNLFDSGMVVESDLLRIQVHVADVQRQVLEAENGLQLSKAALDVALGHALPPAFEPATPLALRPAPPGGLDELKTAALQQRPEILQLRLAEGMTLEQVNEARGDYKPGVGFFSTLEYNFGTDWENQGGNYILGVQLRWNIYDGDAKGARVAEARSNASKLEYQRQDLSNQIGLQVTDAWLRLRTAGQQHAVALSAVSQAEESLRIVKNRYEAGLAPLTDLLDAETTLLATRTHVSQALYQQNLALAGLELSTGRLDLTSPLFD